MYVYAYVYSMYTHTHICRHIHVLTYTHKYETSRIYVIYEFTLHYIILYYTILYTYIMEPFRACQMKSAVKAIRGFRSAAATGASRHRWGFVV